ncbi:MAG: Bax inhibitor-1/YccA family protein [Actinomycetia bacterium]|nr:Bax inhibitor-1/YccA family protein [Actinomycetes bacterium]
MANPVLSHDTFTPAAPSYGYGGYAQAYAAQPAGYGYAPPAEARPATMTLNDVINKTSLLMALLMLSAGVSYVFIPAQLLYPAAMIAGLASIVFPFLVIRRHEAAPTLVVVYALVEGVFIGGISKIFEAYWPGIVVQAALGTFFAAGAVMVGFRFAGFRSTPRMSKIVRLSLFGFAGAALLNFVLRLAGINLGLFPFAGEPVNLLAWIAVLVGIGLALYSLLQDFTFIEHGVAIGAPASQSWIAAYGLIVTMVFLYTQILRALSYVRR